MTRTRLLLLVGLVVVVAAIFWPRQRFSPDMVSGLRVLVTGASSGIGEQLAYQYAKAGASIFITARREALLLKVVNKCKQLGSANAQFGYLAADMANMEQTTLVVQAAVDHLGGLDQVILNHAYIPKARPWTDTQESFDVLQKSMDVNIRSFAHLAVHALPYLKDSNGSITVISSLAGKLAIPLVASYCASKFALDGFFSSFRQEVKSHNVSVTLAVLGGIVTEGLMTMMEDMKANYKFAKDVKDTRWYLASADDCAYEIMRGTTMREREIYFPEGQLIRYLVMFRELIVRFGDIGRDMRELLEGNEK